MNLARAAKKSTNSDGCYRKRGIHHNSGKEESSQTLGSDGNRDCPTSLRDGQRTPLAHRTQRPNGLSSGEWGNRCRVSPDCLGNQTGILPPDGD